MRARELGDILEDCEKRAAVIAKHATEVDSSVSGVDVVLMQALFNCTALLLEGMQAMKDGEE